MGLKADHSPPSSAKVKNAWRYTSTPTSTRSWRGAQLNHRDKSTFTLPGMDPLSSSPLPVTLLIEVM